MFEPELWRKSENIPPFRNRVYFKFRFLFLTKSHLSYPWRNNITYFWDIGFVLGISIVVQLVTGILSVHYTPYIHYSYYIIMYIFREVYYGLSLRYSHSNGASVLFTVLFMHIGRGLYYGSYYYNSNSWFPGILIFIVLMDI